MENEIVEVDSVEDAMSWLTSLKMTSDMMALMRDDPDFNIPEDAWYHWDSWQDTEGCAELWNKRCYVPKKGKLTYYYGIKREDDPVVASFDDFRINKIGMGINQKYAAGRAFAIDPYGNFGMMTVSYWGHSKTDSRMKVFAEPGFGNDWKWFDLRNWDQAIADIKAERQKYISVTSLWKKSVEKFENSRVLIHEMLQYK